MVLGFRGICNRWKRGLGRVSEGWLILMRRVVYRWNVVVVEGSVWKKRILSFEMVVVEEP